MKRISESVLSKVREEAQNIINEAEEKAQEERERAKAQQEVRSHEEKHKMLAEAEDEAARILAQASIKSRQKLSIMKTDVVNKTVNRVKQELAERSRDKNDVRNLIKEAMNGLGMDKGRIYVSPEEVNMTRKSLEGDKELDGKIIEVKEFGCTGGIIAEDIDGKIRIDNTYEARLEMLLPKVLPEISKKLFEET